MCDALVTVTSYGPGFSPHGIIVVKKGLGNQPASEYIPELVWHSKPFAVTRTASGTSMMSRAKIQLPQAPQAVTANTTDIATTALRRHGGAAGPTPTRRRRTRSKMPKS